MSHIATVDVEIKDLDALAKAAKACGLEFVTDAKTFRYYSGRRAPCSHALRVPGNDKAYEIGVVKRADGKSYELQYDPFSRGNGMMDLVSSESDKHKQKLGRLLQAYSTAVARKEMMKAGYRVSEKVDAKGVVRLVCTK